MNSLMKGVIAGLVIMVAVPVGCTYIGAANDAATAPARVLSRTVETDNIITNYERFFDINANFEARKSQIAQVRGFYQDELDPAEKSRLRVEMSAIQQSCRELAQSYNADAQKMNVSVFRDSDLPSELNALECE